MNFSTLKQLGVPIFRYLWGSTRDLLPIILVVGFFQVLVFRQPIDDFAGLIAGVLFVIVGLALFVSGLELGLFPIGESMAAQLTSDVLQEFSVDHPIPNVIIAPAWYCFYWTFIFAFSIGASTSIAEPSLIAVAMKAEQVSGGSIQAWGLRVAVAIGVGIGVAIGTFRIVTGTPLPYYILVGYAIVMVQTYFAPRMIIPIAYDSGGVATSTVTVPLIAALGLGLAGNLPGRDPLVDGFGMIAVVGIVSYHDLVLNGLMQLVRET